MEYGHVENQPWFAIKKSSYGGCRAKKQMGPKLPLRPDTRAMDPTMADNAPGQGPGRIRRGCLGPKRELVALGSVCQFPFVSFRLSVFVFFVVVVACFVFCLFLSCID